MTNFLKSTGKNLNEKGFPLIPIAKGTKAPLVKGWQRIDSTTENLEKWLKNDKFTGVGIKTRYFPAIDIDFKHHDAANELVEFCQEELGATLVRIGQSPKALLPFRLVPGHEPMKKVKSAVYEDFTGAKNAVEVLGDGQQYVAYHIHPDTNEPYHWVDGVGLMEIKPEDLPTLSPEQVDRLMGKVVEVAAKYGMVEVSTQSGTPSGTDFFDGKPKIGLTVEEVRDKVMALPVDHSDDYDLWIKIGMAIQHELGKTDEGLAVWEEFSQQSDRYDPAEMESKWASFDPYSHNDSVTMASVLHMDKGAEVNRKYANLKWLIDKIKQAADTRELTVEIPKQIGQTTLDSLMYNELVLAMQRRYKVVTEGASLSIEDARKLCRPEFQAVKDGLNGKGFPWCENYVYLAIDSKFFNTITKLEVSLEAFNCINNRHLVSPDMIAEGKYSPAFNASHIALNVVRIPICTMKMYSPKQPNVFELDSHPNMVFANTYRPSNVEPVKREDWSEDERDLISRVERALSVIAVNEIDRVLFRQWLSFIIRNVGTKNLKWTIFLQGAQGSGKTYWHTLMTSVLGAQNTRTVTGNSMSSQYCEWAEGHVFGSIEEMKLHGPNRWDAANRLKPFITNDIVAVEMKNQGIRDLVNFGNYLANSQYKDGYPLEESDRRVYPMYSPLQSKADILKFKAENGDGWWRKTHEMTQEHSGALLGWLMETDLTGFDPSESPVSRAKDQMIDLGRSEAEVFVADLITDDDLPHITCKLLMTKDISDMALLAEEPLELRTSAMARVLLTLGFDKLPGRIKIAGVNRYFWTKDAQVLEYNNAQIRELYFEQKKVASNLTKIDDFAQKIGAGLKGE